MANMYKNIVDSNENIFYGGRLWQYWRNKRIKPQFSDGSVSFTNFAIEMFQEIEKYRLKGFEFGNWLTQNDRLDRLAAFKISAVELSKIVGSKNLGFDGTLGIAFGARGKGGQALAHFEPNLEMINLTKNNQGTLAHEWGHALDHSLGKYVSRNAMYSYLSGGHSVASKLLGSNNDESGKKLREYMNILIDSAKACESQKIPGVVNSAYWANRTETFARLFEEYVSYKQHEKGIHNAFLTQSFEKYARGGAYWRPDELKKLIPLMDRFLKEAAKEMNVKTVSKQTTKAAADKQLSLFGSRKFTGKK